MTPCLSRVDLQDRADRGVDLGVHQHDVLAVLERLEDDVRAELDRAGDVDEHVDLLGAARAATGPRSRPAGPRAIASSNAAWRRRDDGVREPGVAETSTARSGLRL